MTDSFSFEMDGLSELDDKLAVFDNTTTQKLLENALMNATLPMMKDAKAGAIVAKEAHKVRINAQNDKVTVDPGLIQNSIKRTRLKKAKQPSVALVVKKKNRKSPYPFYWVFYEFGTTKTAAVPFMRPAFDKNTTVSVERFKKQLGKNIAKKMKEVK